MRTLQIGDFWLEENAGGLSRYYHDLLVHFDPATVQARGLVVGTPAVFERSRGLVRSFAPAESSLATRLLNARSAVLHEISSSRPDLVASHFAIYSLPVLDRLRNLPNVVHFHGPWSGESGVEGGRGASLRLKAAIERLVYQRADKIITLSHAFRRILIDDFGIPEETIRTVPGGVDTDRFRISLSRREAREHLGLPADRPILFTVRRLVHRMGLERLLEVASQVASRIPEILVLIGGSGPLAADLEQQITERGLQQHVKLIGRIAEEDLPVAYRAADFTVVPSVKLEGFGLITLESLACGTPVFVTPIGGLPEVVEPFAPQCVFESDSPEAITDRLVEALTGKLHVPSSDDCQVYTKTRFAWPDIAARVVEVYREALQSRE